MSAKVGSEGGGGGGSTFCKVLSVVGIILLAGAAGAAIALAVVYGGDFDNSGGDTVVLARGDAIQSCEASDAHVWTYNTDCTGKDGEMAPPTMWGATTDNEACSAGLKQSPINIATSDVQAGCAAGSFTTFAFDSGACKYGQLEIAPSVKNWEIKFEEPLCGTAQPFITVDGDDYMLLQFHFHSVSEHTVGGGYYDGELHMVHKNEDNGKYIVIGIFMQANADLRDNQEVENYWARLAIAADKLEAGSTSEAANEATKGTEAEAELGVQDQTAIASDNDVANAYAMLPAGRKYYTYSGSLTTPPCSEVVTWVVMAEPVLVSADQIALFRDSMSRAHGSLVDQSGSNARPTQPLNGRDLSECELP